MKKAVVILMVAASLSACKKEARHTEENVASDTDKSLPASPPSPTLPESIAPPKTEPLPGAEPAPKTTTPSTSEAEKKAGNQP